VVSSIASLRVRASIAHNEESNPKNAIWKPEKKKRALFEYPDRTRGPRDDASRKAKGKKNNNATTRAKEENTAALPRFWREKKERRRLKQHSRESDMF
jgi:hypothetical protein